MTNDLERVTEPAEECGGRCNTTTEQILLLDGIYAMKPEELLAFEQAATESSDAKWQARVKDLEEALPKIREELHACQAVIHLAGGFDPLYVKEAQAQMKAIDALLSTTTPDTALQKVVLEKRNGIKEGYFAKLIVRDTLREISRLANERHQYDICELVTSVDSDKFYTDTTASTQDIESLQVKLAMQAEAIRPFMEVINTSIGRIPVERLSFANWNDLIKSANATRADVDNWVKGKKAEWLAEHKCWDCGSVQDRAGATKNVEV